MRSSNQISSTFVLGVVQLERVVEFTCAFAPTRPALRVHSTPVLVFVGKVGRLRYFESDLRVEACVRLSQTLILEVLFVRRQVGTQLQSHGAPFVQISVLLNHARLLVDVPSRSCL